MKIAILKRDASKRGGLEKYTSRLISAFQNRGCSVTLVSSGSKKNTENLVSCQVSCQLKSPFTFWNLAKFDHFCKRYTRSNPHDLVLGMDRTTEQTHLRAGNGVHAAYLQERRRIEGKWKNISFSLNPLHRLILKFEKAAFEDPSLQKIFVNSRLVQSQLLEHYKIDPSKIHVIHNGVEWEEMAPDFRDWPQKKVEIADRFKLDPSRYHFLFVGHNYERKGLRPLLHALSLLQDRDFHLSIVGDDKYKGEFQQLTAQLGLKSHVSFWGSRLNILPFYQMADALVIPSLYDPFANVTVEALAMGLFIVSSPLNGGHEVLQPGSGIVTDIHNIEIFSQALAQAMHHPKTRQSSALIRASVSHLDFSTQLSSFCDQCLS